MRVIVENTFAQLKKWKVVGDIFHHYSPIKHNVLDVNVVVYAVACLTNMQIKKKNPLRKYGWVPPPPKKNEKSATKDEVIKKKVKPKAKPPKPPNPP